MLRFTTVLLLSLALPLLAHARKPNVILILTDDQGSVDTKAYGAKDLETPHMDALVETGVRFTTFYSGAPVCSPSRAACLTGRNPHRAGVPNNAATKRGDKNGMPPAQVTIAEMLKGAGYATAHIGKWHLGYVDAMRPNAQGFDYSFGHMGGCIDNFSHFYYWGGPNQHDLWRNGVEVFEDGKFFGDLMVEEAGRFMTENKERPFFIYFAINQPHYPYQGDARWLKHYRHEKKLDHPRDLYAAFVSTIDDRIGQVVAKVESLGLTNDTIIIFQSDHGHSVEERAHRGGGSSGPYRGHKFTLLEGGIRVPAMIKWPGRIPAGETRRQLATGCDWFPTIASLCGVDPPKHRIDGKDLSGVLQLNEAPSPHDHFCWEYRGQLVARQGPWKLMATGREPDWKLYHVDRDPGESKDVAEANPEVFQKLKKLHAAWRKDKSAQE